MMRGKVGGRALITGALDDKQAAGAPAIGKRTLVGAESAGPLIQRKEDPAAATPGASSTSGEDGAADGPPATGVLVDDHVAAGPQQMRRADFLAKVEPAIKSAVSAELGPPWNVADCPYIEKYLAIYWERPAAVVEQFVRRYTGSP
ncbi:MAG TPA: hypothetical protein VN253_07590, partial [Kofleriaceae bacterium]|nr:hypothetical protein [Kofleriaceae bacterium]